jgi:hypothetical protein
MMTYLLDFLAAGHNQFVAVPIAAPTNQIGPWARALASLRGCVAKHPDIPGALPYQRSAARSERAWIGLGLAAWNGGGTGGEW